MASALTEGLSATTLQQFELLQRRFVAGLPQRWREINGATTPQDLESALHRLAGSAGSYGFPQLGQCARAAESLVHAGPQGALAQALAELQARLEQTPSAAPEIDAPDQF